MPVIEGTTNLKSAVGEYSFAVDGGAASTITLRSSNSLGNSVPAGSVVVSGYIEVDTLAVSAAGSVAITLESAGDLLASAAVTAGVLASTGRKSIIPVGTGASTVKTTVARSIAITISGGTVTAGVFRVVVFYR
jgi:hypothetical protein